MAKAVSMEPVPTTTWWIYLLEGIGAVLIGLLLLMAPAATVVAITLFLGFYWLFVGVLELVRMFVDRSVPWYWSLAHRPPRHRRRSSRAEPSAVRGGDSAGDPRHLSRRARHRHRHLRHHRRLFRRRHRLVHLRRAQSPHRHIAVELAGCGDARRAVRVRHPALDRGHRADRLGLPRPRRSACTCKVEDRAGFEPARSTFRVC